MKKMIIFLLGLMIVLTCISPALAADTGITVSPSRVMIGPGFNGAELAVSGEAPTGADIYIKVASPDDSVLDLSKKGKVGLFWMNVENTTVSGVPKLYQVYSSGTLDRLTPDLQKDTGISPGFAPIYTSARVFRHSGEGPVQLSGEKAGSYVAALVDIYRENGLYAIRENSVSAAEGKFKADIKLPPNVPQEKCSITVYAVRGGKIVATAGAPFEIAGTGVVRWLSREAIYNGPEYGFMAVMFALAFGAGIAFIFSYLEGLFGGGKGSGMSAGAGH